MSNFNSMNNTNKPSGNGSQQRYSAKKTIGKNSAPKNPKKELGKALAIIGVALVLLIGCILFAINKFIDSKIEKINYETEDQREFVTGELNEARDTDTFDENPTWEAVGKPGVANAAGLPCICDTEDVLNVLVIGIDARTENEAARNDTTMIVSINTKTKKIVMASLLRDVLVNYEGKEPNRVNCAYAYGGAAFVKKTLKQNFNIDINNYVVFNFFSFVDIVEAMGGIDLELNLGEIQEINRILVEEVNVWYKRPTKTDILPEKPGKYHLNGYQAIGFARNRHTGLTKADGTIGGGSDFARTTRQRTVIQALIDRAKDLTFKELSDTLDAIMPEITTNMSKTLIKSMIKTLPLYITYEMKGVNVPQDGNWKYGKYYYNEEKGLYRSIIDADFKKCVTQLYDEIYK